MSVLLQVCFVIVTIAVVAIAVATIKVMQHFRQSSDEFSTLAVEARQLVDQLGNVARDAQEIVSTFRDVAPRVRRVMDRFEAVGDRAVTLSDTVIREVEMPVRTLVALVRGFRYGTQQLVERLTQRFTGRVSTNGGRNYE
jgi:methyl-accepting chemotaxis protein